MDQEDVHQFKETLWNITSQMTSCLCDETLKRVAHHVQKTADLFHKRQILYVAHVLQGIEIPLLCDGTKATITNVSENNISIHMQSGDGMLWWGPNGNLMNFHVHCGGLQVRTDLWKALAETKLNIDNKFKESLLVLPFLKEGEFHYNIFVGMLMFKLEEIDRSEQHILFVLDVWSEMANSLRKENFPNVLLEIVHSYLINI